MRDDDADAWLCRSCDLPFEGPRPCRCDEPADAEWRHRNWHLPARPDPWDENLDPEFRCLHGDHPLSPESMMCTGCVRDAPLSESELGRRRLRPRQDDPQESPSRSRSGGGVVLVLLLLALGAGGTAATASINRGDPRATLAGVVSRDTPVLATLDGQWVPQVASSWVQEGEENAQEVLDDVTRMKEQDRELLTVRSENFATWSGRYWVTVHPQPFPTRDEANAWCDRQGRTRDECFGVRVVPR